MPELQEWNTTASNNNLFQTSMRLNLVGSRLQEFQRAIRTFFEDSVSFYNFAQVVDELGRDNIVIDLRGNYEFMRIGEPPPDGFVFAFAVTRFANGHKIGIIFRKGSSTLGPYPLVWNDNTGTIYFNSGDEVMVSAATSGGNKVFRVRKFQSNRGRSLVPKVKVFAPGNTNFARLARVNFHNRWHGVGIQIADVASRDGPRLREILGWTFIVSAPQGTSVELSVPRFTRDAAVRFSSARYGSNSVEARRSEMAQVSQVYADIAATLENKKLIGTGAQFAGQNLLVTQDETITRVGQNLGFARGGAYHIEQGGVYDKLIKNLLLNDPQIPVNERNAFPIDKFPSDEFFWEENRLATHTNVGNELKDLPITPALLSRRNEQEPSDRATAGLPGSTIIISPPVATTYILRPVLSTAIDTLSDINTNNAAYANILAGRVGETSISKTTRATFGAEVHSIPWTITTRGAQKPADGMIAVLYWEA